MRWPWPIRAFRRYCDVAGPLERHSRARFWLSFRRARDDHKLGTPPSGPRQIVGNAAQ